MRASSRILLALCLVVLAVGASAMLAGSVGDLHDRVAAHSRPLAIGLIVVAGLAASAAAVAASRLAWSLSREARPQKAQAPADVVKAAEVQAEKAAAIVEMIGDAEAKRRLNGDLDRIKADGQARRFHAVVFGTGSAGKTSLINALLGREAGEVTPTIGTTQQAQTHDTVLTGVDGTLVLTDTPGLAEIGRGGVEREAMARDLAARADLLLFVVDHDLIRSEHEPLVALARQGKRSIVALNKKDKFTPEDADAILAKLRERLAGVVPPADVIAVAADPRPTLVRFKDADGNMITTVEAEPADVAPLLHRVAAILKREGDALRAGNLLLRAHLVSQEAQAQLTTERRVKAQAVVDKFQWITAATVFTNPLPILDLMATGAVQFQMIAEVGQVYGVSLSTADARTVGGHMIQLLLKLGMVEAATSLIAGVFKSSLVGFAAGGALQGTTMAYLTHVSGLTFIEYFERGQRWGDGGMQAALVRQFDLNSRASFLREFAMQAVDRVVSKVAHGGKR